MALPSTFSGAQFPRRGWGGGPFISSGGNVYVVMVQNASLKTISIVKTTDPTVSANWAEIVNWVPNASANGIEWLDVVQVGDVLHVATQPFIATCSCYYRQFDMSTDAWAITAEVVGTGNLVASGGIAVRSTGEAVVCWTGDTATVMGTAYDRQKYSRRTGANTWTAAADLFGTGNQTRYICSNCCLGASDRVHFSFWDSTNQDVYHVSLSSGNVLDTAATIDVTTAASGNDKFVLPKPAMNNASAVRVPYKDSDSKLSIGKFTSGANPTITVDTAVSAGAVYNGATGPNTDFQCAPLATKDAEFHAVWVDSASQHVFHDSDTGSGWGTDVAVAAASTYNSVTCSAFARGGGNKLAYVYGGTLNYNEVDLGSAPATPSVIAGVGSVQTPVPIAVTIPAKVSGAGTVSQPQFPPVPSVAGVGAVQTSHVIVLAAVPSAVAGTGTVQTPTVVTGVSQTVTPSVVAGTGTVQTATEIARALPAAILGVGTVQTPVGVATATPGRVLGTGTIPAPAEATGPDQITGTGTVQTPLGIATAKPGQVAGVGSVQTSHVIVLAALPSSVNGVGTVQAPTIVTAVNATVTPAEIDGVGTVQTATEIAVATPARVLGSGAVQGPTGVDVPTPANILGTGTVQTPVSVLVAKPGQVAGVGSVTAPSEATGPAQVVGSGTVQTAREIVAPLPTTVAGTGAVQTPLVVLAATPTRVLGTGLVQAPAEATGPNTVNGTGTAQTTTAISIPTPTQIPAVGTVQVPVVIGTAKPGQITGTGTVQTPAATPTGTPANILGTGLVQTIVAIAVATPTRVAGVGVVQTVQFVGAIQLSSPDSVVYNIGWTDESGGTATLHTKISEAVANDATYITVTV
jgi:hypothetical protein